MSVCLSVRPRGTTRLPLDRFSRNVVFETFSKICPGDSSFIQISQHIIYCTWRRVCLAVCLSHDVLLRKIKVSEKSLEKIKTHFVFRELFSENRGFYKINWKNVCRKTGHIWGYIYIYIYIYIYMVYCLLHYFNTIVILQAFYLFTIVVTSNITVSFTQRLAPQVILN